MGCTLALKQNFPAGTPGFYFDLGVEIADISY